MRKLKDMILPLMAVCFMALLIPHTQEAEEVPTEACTEVCTEVTVVELVAEPVEVVAEPEPVLTELGEFKLTAYCSCSRCCGKWAECRPEGIVYGASGEELIAGYSVAVDTSVIPYGTVLVINGQEYEAMDCGGAIKGKRIDIYFNEHEDAVQFGVQYADVSIREDNDNDRDK